MITEDYVSFETAKLLKEKGFAWYTYAYYEDEDNPNISLRASKAMNWNEDRTYLKAYSKPTLQMAMKWLRYVHGLFIHIDVIREASCWLADVQDIKGDVRIYPIKEAFSNYEEACEAAIKYCLENLV